MSKVYIKKYLTLHFIVLIWGFTAILGKLISINSLSLVWYRVLIGGLCVLLFILYKNKSLLNVNKKLLYKYISVGIVLAMHWFTFFQSLKMSNVSITLIAVSSGAFFTAILEPIWFKRKIVIYEILLGIIVIIGLAISFSVIEISHIMGFVVAMISSFLACVFSIANESLVLKHNPLQISFYELLTGCIFLFMILLFTGSVSHKLFILSALDWVYLLLLGSICTAYAFYISIDVMSNVSAYTVMLTTNLEPIYGIILAYIIFGDEEKMNNHFYAGGIIILIAIFGNGFLKNQKKNIAIKKK